MIQDHVKSGRYTSNSEVIREALRILDDQYKSRQETINEVNAAIDKGLKSGVSDMSFEEIVQEAKDEFFAQKAAV